MTEKGMPENTDEFEKLMRNKGDETDVLNIMVTIFDNEDVKELVKTDPLGKDLLMSYIKEIRIWRSMYGDKQAYKLMMTDMRTKEMLYEQ